VERPRWESHPRPAPRPFVREGPEPLREAARSADAACDATSTASGTPCRIPLRILFEQGDQPRSFELLLAEARILFGGAPGPAPRPNLQRLCRALDTGLELLRRLSAESGGRSLRDNEQRRQNELVRDVAGSLRSGASNVLLLDDAPPIACVIQTAWIRSVDAAPNALDLVRARAAGDAPPADALLFLADRDESATVPARVAAYTAVTRDGRASPVRRAYAMYRLAGMVGARRSRALLAEALGLLATAPPGPFAAGLTAAISYAGSPPSRTPAAMRRP